MIDDHLSVGIWYAWKQILEHPISLSVDLFLSFGYWLWLACVRAVREVFLLADLYAGLLNYGPSNMMADSVEL